MASEPGMYRVGGEGDRFELVVETNEGHWIGRWVDIHEELTTVPADYVEAVGYEREEDTAWD